MKNNPTPEEVKRFVRRRSHHLERWGLSETDKRDLPSNMKIWIEQADKESGRDKKSDNYYPGAISIEDSISKMPKVDVASITKRRLEYEHNNNFEEPEKGIGELLNTKEQE